MDQNNQFNNQNMNNNYQSQQTNQPVGNYGQPNNGSNQPMNNGYNNYNQPMYNQGYMQPQQNNNGVKIAIIVVVLAIVAVVAYMFATGKFDKKDDTSNSNSNETSESNSNEVSNSNSNSNEISNWNSNEVSNSNSQSNSNIVSDSNSNSNTVYKNTTAITDSTKLYGNYTCNYKGVNTKVSITSTKLSLVMTSGGKSVSLSSSFVLDNSIEMKYNYKKTGYNAYNLYLMKDSTITTDGKTTQYAGNSVLGLGLDSTNNNLHLFISDDKTKSEVDFTCVRG